MSKIKTKDIKELLDEYMESLDSPFSRVMCHWEEITGTDLCKRTVYKGVRNGILYIGALDSSTRTLLYLYRKSVLFRFNSIFPSYQAKDLRSVPMY